MLSGFLYRDPLAENARPWAKSRPGDHQGGRAADFGTGEGGLLKAVREYTMSNAIMETSGGDPSTGGD
jgi:hypothetical protein